MFESTPNFVRAGESLAVWAGVHVGDGKRFTVGNSFVAELLARDPLLSKTYHAASPAQDRALFTDALTKRVATMA